MRRTDGHGWVARARVVLRVEWEGDRKRRRGGRRGRCDFRVLSSRKSQTASRFKGQKEQELELEPLPERPCRLSPSTDKHFAPLVSDAIRSRREIPGFIGADDLAAARRRPESN